MKTATAKPIEEIPQLIEAPTTSPELDEIEATLATVASWPPWLHEGHESRIEELCRDRHRLLQKLDRRQSLAEAQRHRSEVTVRVMAHTLPLGFPCHALNLPGTLAGLVERFDASWLPDIQKAAAAPLCSILDVVEPALRRSYLEADAKRFVAMAAPLPGLEQLAAAEVAYWGEGEPSAAVIALAALRKGLVDFRTQAHAHVAIRLDVLRERMTAGDIMALLELLEIATDRPGTLPLDARTLRQKLAEVLVKAGPEKFAPVDPNWPPPPRPTPPPPEDRQWWEPRNPY